MKKIISTFLIICLIFGTVSFSAFAFDSSSLSTAIDKGLIYFKDIAKNEYLEEGSYSVVNFYNTAVIAGSKNLNNKEFDFMKANCSSDGIIESAQSTEISGRILTALMLSEDRKSLADILVKRQAEDGSFPFIKNGTEIVLINDVIWSMIALSQDGSVYDYEKSLDFLKNKMRSDGGYNFAGDESDSSVDVTAMALIAFSQYKENPIAKDLTQKALGFLNSKLDSDGKFIGDYMSKNSCTQSTAIIGLIAAGENINSEKWIKNGNNIGDCLLDFQDENGGFWYDRSSPFFTEPDEFSSKQSLVAVNSMINGNVIFTELKNQSSDVSDESENQDLSTSDNTSVNSSSDSIINSDKNSDLTSNKANHDIVDKETLNPISGDKGIILPIILVVVSILILVVLILFALYSKKKNESNDKTKDSDQDKKQ